MHDSVTSDDEVPAKNRAAERWRLAGEELRRVAPEVFESMLAMLVMTKTVNSHESSDDITKSYFLT